MKSLPQSKYPQTHSGGECYRCGEPIKWLNIAEDVKAMPELVAVELVPNDGSWEWHECFGVVPRRNSD